MAKKNAHSTESKDVKLTPKEELFCYEYVLHINATKAAINAKYSEKTARQIGARLLSKVNIQKRIEYLKNNLAETAEISALKVLKEHEKIAFADAGQLRDGWMLLTDFEQLTEEQKSIIQEVTTKATKYGTEIKIKLYDKQRSLDSINAMLGFDAPIRTELTGANGKPFNPEPITVEIIDNRDKIDAKDTDNENIQ
ncbi:MAG: terminase small subunit [Bacteroidales bacterium]|jgi:phage terminase small subunit|nr:terminase small subunit [Bacteroidales bacterium]